MPQFDSATFFSQLFWFLVIYYGFYIIIFKNYLPSLTRILKVRQKKLNLLNKEKANDKEFIFIHNFSKKASEKNIDLLTVCLNNYTAWSKNFLDTLSFDHLKDSHLYLVKNFIHNRKNYWITDFYCRIKKLGF